MNCGKILIVDDDQSLRRITHMQLEEAGYDVAAAADGKQALAAMREAPPALVVTDVRMPGISGMDLLRSIRAGYPQTGVIMMTAFGTVQTAVEAIKAGADDYITKPIDYEELLLVVGRALEQQRLSEQARNPQLGRESNCGFESIIGSSKPMSRLLQMAARVAPKDSVVLLRGETGTGKELLARAIHENSLRRDQPFVTINCGAIPRDLLESELFGYTKGSFTGALAAKAGRVEAAAGGTLFLDEVGELPLELQVKLLRLIQHGEIEKIGAATAIKVDVRIIAATHRNLQAMIEDGTFREDLYYRLAVVPLELPPLRERAEDIPELIQYLFPKMKRKHGLPNLKLPDSLLPWFCGHRWPGNVRELENVIERLVVLSTGDEITLADLPDPLRTVPQPPEVLELELPGRGTSLEAVERELMLRALRKFDWNQTRAARYLDISRRTLIYRIEKHGLRREHGVLSAVPSGGSRLR